MIEGQADIAQWLRIAKEAYDASTSYADANWRKAWERNIALFQSRHPSGSKYNSDAFKQRSRLFRPKTKAAVRKNEAAAAAAFFSNVDVVSVEPRNKADPKQKITAEIINELINYRLTERGQIPWYMTLIGAFQEAQVIGVICSYQYWKYEEKASKSYEPVLDDMGQPLTDPSGAQLAYEVENVERVHDKPCIDLIPIENIRFDPGASWVDVVGSSPYIIRKVPMYVDSVRQKMGEGPGKWKTYSDGEIRAAMSEYDTTRQAREHKRQDPLADNAATLKEFEIIWVHENFVRLGGEEVVYWTLGTQHMLTDPASLKEAYLHGKRPLAIGVALIEAHKPMPDSLVAIGSELQKEANEITNQRMDNVRLVLNKKWIIKRGKQVDTAALMRNVPGAAILADDPEEDIRELQWPDVTSSSYQEQDRLNVDFDELVGSFSQSSVQTNRQLNETVGGMQLAAGGASMLTEYLIRTFTETWVEEALNQLAMLESFYEDDQELLNLVAGQSASLKREGIEQITEEMLTQPVSVRVNVGMGATDPLTKQNKFTNAMAAYSQIMSNVPDADAESVRTEVFGLVGYKDGARFFKSAEENPEVAQLQAQVQQLTQQLQMAMGELENKQAEADVKMAEIDYKTQELGIRQQETQVEAMRVQAEAQRPPDVNADAEVARIEAATQELSHEAQMLALLEQIAALKITVKQQQAVAAVKAAEKPKEPSAARA